MTLSNDVVVERFVRGSDRGKSNRMEIEEMENGDTLLLDYGWAILAHRSQVNGDITVYQGWQGYSSTTTKHVYRLLPERNTGLYERYGYQLGFPVSLRIRDHELEVYSGIGSRTVTVSERMPSNRAGINPDGCPVLDAARP